MAELEAVKIRSEYRKWSKIRNSQARVNITPSEKMVMLSQEQHSMSERQGI